jgi:DNA-binding CsgD family transcriptional regulator
MTRLVGRDDDVDELIKALHGRGAIVWGAAGVGKTALVAAVANRIAEHGDQADWIVATAASQAIPFGALAPLLVDVDVELPPTLVLAAISRRLRATPAERPAVLVVDDAHLLDDASAATVLGLVISGAARALVTVRSGEPRPDAVDALWKDGFLASTMLQSFDRATTRAFLEQLLGGEVAGSTVELLWRHTQGNALYLHELANGARARGQLVSLGGVWVWKEDRVVVPPRLAELLARRFAGLSDPAMTAVAALTLGEPVDVETLIQVSSLDAVAELEERALVVARDHHGRPHYGFTHPLLGSAVSDQLSAVRRRQVADALIAANSPDADPVRSALWQLNSSGPAAVDRLSAGARSLLLTQPALAQRMAERAVALSDDVEPALLLADARAELGELDGARRAISVAAARARSPAERVELTLTDAGVTTFVERRPDVALGVVVAARRELPAPVAAELDAFRALILLFSARPAAALAAADEVLALAPRRSTRMRAASVRVGALALVDRSNDAMHEGRELLADVARHPTSPYASGLAHIVYQLARFVAWENQFAPIIDPAGATWPILDRPDDVIDDRLERVAHPLFAGGRLLKEGDLAHALPLLREAVAQQSRGRCLLRSEAVSLLVTAQAATGDREGAARLLARQPPDRVALYPGLELSTRAAEAAAAGRGEAIELAFAAADEAIAVGGRISAVAYLADAARYGAATRAAARLDEMGVGFEAAIARARASYVRARASGDGTMLLEAAEAHAAIALRAPAAELAQLASAALGRNRRLARRADLLAADMRRHLRLPAAEATSLASLTRRELEVARLASQGMNSRQIAALLVVSVRTVESHLAAAYRKLDIRSRQDLPTALAAMY